MFPAFTKTKKASEEWEDEKYFYFVDEWGTYLRMPKHEGKYYDMYRFPLAEASEVEDPRYQWPEARSVQPEVLEEARNYRAAGYPVILTENYANGFLQTGPKIYGFEKWLTMIALEEKRVRAVLDKLLEKKIEYWDKILGVFGQSLDIVCEMDDLGEQRGPFISPEMFRKIIKPYYKVLFPYIKKKSGAKLFMHSCGSIVKLIPDLIDVGVDIIGPVQISAAGMDPAALKKEFGMDLTFWGGGVNTQTTLSTGSPLQVCEEVKRNVEIFSKDGGYVFAAVHNIQPNVPIENIVAMWEAFLASRN